ncbi:MAG TPA: MFS transporter [Mycobacteriales bacterium]|nr:MFS transporter [Mycobacteriales bacterium]
MFARYREVLREPHVARLLFTALVGRLPQGMTGLATLLLLTPSVGYGKAGVASGLCIASSGVANIVLARAVDRFGVRPTLLPAALVYAVFSVALAAVSHRGYGPALGLCGVLGLAAAPISSVSRGLWPDLLGPERAQVLYGLEATAQELVFIVGPAGVALIAGLASPRAALVTSGVLGLVGVLGFATAPTFATDHRAQHDFEAPASLLRTRVLNYSLVGVALTVGLSMAEIATVAFVGGRHATAASGVVLAVWSVGSLLGGLAFGAGATRVTDGGLALWVAIAGGGLAVATLSPGRVGLAVILFASGGSIAPALARLYTRLGDVAPSSSPTESFGWLAVGLQVGSSLGAALGGWSIDGIGARWTFALSGLAALLGLLVIRPVASYGAVRQAAHQDAA